MAPKTVISDIFVFLAFGRAILEPLGGVGGGNQTAQSDRAVFVGLWEGHLGPSWGVSGRPIRLHLGNPSLKKLGSPKCRRRAFFICPRRHINATVIALLWQGVALELIVS